MRLSFAAIVLTSCLATPAFSADDVTLESVPPVVVSTTPVAGSDTVAATTNEIRITFSQPMQDNSWSWSTLSKKSFPEVTGEPKYAEDGRTCVLPVKLEPGRTYAIWANTQKFTNFRSAGGRSAVPYLLVFKTAAN
ncbi:MAG: Ig-like domain-containing protein [Planctomycetota bacterium]